MATIEDMWDDMVAENQRLEDEVERLREIARLILLACNHPSGAYGQKEADTAADLAAGYFAVWVTTPNYWRFD